MAVKHRGLKSSGAMVAVLILAGALSANAGAWRASTDVEIRRAVLLVLQTTPYLTVFDNVQVKIVEAGEVVLHGSVQYRHRRSALLARVATLPGVRAVRDEISVQSASASDEQLRRQLFERLYYGGGIDGGAQPEWPVKILVNDGSVTLVGWVDNSSDRERLEAMARSVDSRGVENLVQAHVTYVRQAQN